jgi:CRISPR-associated endonuclease/helicase Cas3
MTQPDALAPCLWAHSAPSPDRGRHLLVDHLYGTGVLAEKFAQSFQAGPLARYAGLIHDVGKAAPDWQAGLAAAEAKDHQAAKAGQGGRRTRVGVDHKTAGAWLAWSAGSPNRRLGEVVGQVVYGHHSHVGSRQELKDLFDPGLPDPAVREQQLAAIARVSALVPEVAWQDALMLPLWFSAVPPEEGLLAAELLTRMVASAVYDADVLDTRQFEEQAQAPDLYGGPDLAALGEGFEQRRARVVAGRTSPVATAREELAGVARDAAAGPRGFVRMAFPTGAGKTMSAGRFAVHHAVRWGLRRMIYAAPFLSITTQNADVMRSVFGAEHVLEHHSGADLDRWSGSRPGCGARSGRVRSAAENWDMPVVVTTVVQLFESLFSNKPSALRKVHRVAGSVIVIDEVQSLPDRLLLPILSALRHLVEYFGATVLLCTATQPAFEALPPLRDLEEKGLIRNIVADSHRYAPVFRRVTYEWRLDPKPALGQIGRDAAEHDQVLVIVNTTRDAAQVHRAMGEAGCADAMHLSTRMAAGHRARALQQIRGRLSRGQTVRVVSTQLVEAGVDVDFPVVYRAWAPAEALCQAGGRANREGRLPEGRVIIFEPADGGAPPGYMTAAEVTRQYFGPGLADPDAPGPMSQYYRARYLAKGIDGEAGGADIQHSRTTLDFPEVARLFRMIDDFGVSVVVRYESGEDSACRLDALISQARRPRCVPARVLRDLQPWTATLPRSVAIEAERRGDAEVLLGDLLLWRGDYHQQRGIEVEAGAVPTVL